MSSTPVWLWVLLGCIGAGAAMFAVLMLLVAADQPASAPGSHGTATPAGIASTGIFQERPSKIETPTVAVSTDVDAGVILILNDAQGRSYNATAFPGSPASMTVPAGDYSVEVRSVDGSVGPNTGTAVFRRYRQYDAAFTASEDPPPIQLGD